MRLELLLLAAWSALARAAEVYEDLRPEASQRRIHDIIRSHEDYKYGQQQHGGHEYEDDPQSHYGSSPYQQPHQAVAYQAQPVGKRQSYFVLGKAYDTEHKPASADSKIYDYYPKIETAYKKPSESVAVYHHPKHKYEAYEETDPHSYEDAEPYAQPDPVVNSAYATVDHHPRVYVKPGPFLPKKVYKVPVKHEYVVPHAKEYVVPHANEYVKDSHGSAEKSHKEAHYGDHGQGYHGDHGEEKHLDHRGHEDYEEAGHKLHASHGGHKDQHSKYHNKASYERDRGYHYEKSYAYDRIRAHHDIGKSHDDHAAYDGHHSQQGGYKKGQHGGHTHVYFKKGHSDGGYGYGKHGHHLNDHYKAGGHQSHAYHPIHSHAYKY